jgi:adenosylcobinamide kinase/adenosylcobinamide-phosphate guanylyltransferase
MLVLGGARSGKSSLSLKLCNKMEGKHYFIATAKAFDDEMKDRIGRHKEERGEEWETIEEPIGITGRIKGLDREGSIILVDCLTLWLSNLYMRYESDIDRVYDEIGKLIASIEDIKGRLVLVSNEVGMGIVPENKLARLYRDASGAMNRKVADKANKVIISFAGCPVVLKSE